MSATSQQDDLERILGARRALETVIQEVDAQRVKMVVFCLGPDWEADGVTLLLDPACRSGQEK